MTEETNEAAFAHSQRVREPIWAAAFVALGVILPILFHLLSIGRVFLPMHLPVLLAGLALSPRIAWAVGLITPWLSSWLTGMPPMPMPVMMTAELIVLAEAASLATAARLPAWAGGALAVGARCMVSYVIVTYLASWVGLPSGASGIASVLSGTPGIILQIVAGPAFAAGFRRLRPAAAR